MFGIANWLMNQRSARWSYITIGSPLFVDSQGPPNPCHSALPGAGPYSRVGGSSADPLLQIANERFTHWT